MRAEHRHKLQTNELAKDLEIGLQKLRPHMTTVFTVIGAALILFGVFSYWRNSQAEKAQTAWSAYETAVLTPELDLDAAQKVFTSEQLGGQEAQEWAALAWADRQLLRANSEYLLLRESAKDRLESVADLYKQFASGGSHESIRNRAHLGLARIHELRGEVDDAIAEYGRVKGALEGIAQDRIKSLERDGAAADVKWLAETEAIRPSIPEGGGIPGVRPPFGAETPAAEVDELDFDPNRPLEDILGGFGGDDAESDSDRYDAPPAEGDADSADSADGTAEQ
ncbi:MAG: hypothetical protein CMJ58_10505 [Planctomycetaceae bacterium]|nr:hypothetical protein [Planctomycetaceae bacterium]